MTSQPTPNPESARVTPRRRPPTRRRVLLWLTVIFLLTLVIAAAVAYFERLSIVERIFRDALADRGLEAELQVERFTLDGLVLGNVVLREDGRIVLSANRITAGYDFREALNGRIRSVDVERAVVRIGLDEDFQIADGWLQPSGDGGGPTIPYQGVTLRQSRIDLSTPFGDVPIVIDGRIDALERFDLDLRIAPATLIRDDLRITLSGPIDAVRDDDTLRLDADLDIPSVALGDTSARKGRVQTRGTLALDTRRYTGPLSAIFASGTAFGGSWSGLDLALDGTMDTRDPRYMGPVDLALARFEADTVQATTLALASTDLSLSPDAVSGQGTLTADTLAGFDATATELVVAFTLDSVRTGTATVAASRVALDPTRARSLAESLSLNRVLAAAPVTRDFASGLTDEVRRTLLGGALETVIAFDFTDTRTVALNAPLTWRGANTLTLRPAADTPAYRYDPDADDLELAFSARLSGPRGLALDNASLSAISANGITPDSIEGFSARLRTDAWVAQTPDGRETRLDPVDARISTTPARTRLSGALAYSGDIPGGYVTNLRTEGDLTISPGGRLRVDYATEAPLTFERLLTPSGPRLEDFSATLVSGESVFTGTPDDGAILATLTDARFRFLYDLEDGTAEDVSITAARLDAEGQLRTGVQDWSVDLVDAALRSDTFIGEGTTASTPAATLTARLADDAPLRFTFDAQTVKADTTLASVRAMPISADGTLADFEVAFGPGRLRSPNPAVPVTTVTGTAYFQDGEWVGDALADLPGAQARPLDVTFQFQDGRGVADIRFDDLFFSPDGGLQPQDYIPTLRGKISRVTGAVDGAFTLNFGVDRPLDGTGYIDIADLDLGTAPGPVEGLSTRIEFDSIFPLKTTGKQTLSLRTFDPGLPLDNGDIVYELLPEGIRIHSAVWPLGDGRVFLEPLLWLYGADTNTAVLNVDGVSIQAFLDRFGTEAVTASGILQGRLPVEISGVDVQVRGGRVEVVGGGAFSYEAPQTDTAAAQSETTQLAFDALKEFNYQTFAMNIDGPLDGEITIELGFIGTTPAKLPLPSFVRLNAPIPFEFDITLTGQIFNILRSLNPADALARAKAEICRTKPESCASVLPENLQ